MVGEFLKQFRQRGSLGFPDALQQAYSQVVTGLRGCFPDLDEVPYSLDDDGIASVAAQFYRLFPSHCLKCLDSLAREESAALQRAGTSMVLGWPSITLVDIGCGTAAATAALLSLIQQYQEFVLSHGRLLRRVNVQAIGLDPSDNMLELYRTLLGQYSHLLADWLIDVSVHTVLDRFPDGVWEIARVLKPGNGYLGLAAMSNIVRVLERSFDSGSTVWFERFRRAVTGEQVGEPGFGEAEGNALRYLLEEWELDRIGLLAIATAGKHDVTKVAWHRYLDQMDMGIRNSVLPHGVYRRGVKEARSCFENPPDSWWRASRGHTSYDERYYSDFMLITRGAYASDEQWRSVTSQKNLELAWARARRHALHDDLADEIEILLFDRLVQEKLDRLRRHLLLGDWRALQLNHMQRYDTPKKRGETRPRALARLEEQIVAGALVQSVGSRADAHRRASYSYRLNPEPDEFLYQYWLGVWKGFLADSHKRAKSRLVLKSDVSHFYERVQQGLLIDVVFRVLGIGGRLDPLVSALLLRDCGPPHRPGRGLPEGHIASGFFADLYLAQADRAFAELPGVTFARYADDMVFAIEGSESDARLIERKVRTGLEQLALQPSCDKTYVQSGGQYVSETSLDQVLRQLDEDRFKRLIRQVYRLNGAYRKAYSLDPWGFLTQYAQLLRLIPVYVSEPWLRRKVQQYSGWHDLLAGRRLRFPSLPASPEGNRSWLDELLALNARWKKALDGLCADLVTLCVDSIDQLASTGLGDSDRTKARRRLRFAAYRLCVLGLNPVADLLATQMVARPCTVPVGPVSRGLAESRRSDLLMGIIEMSDSEYVRACAIRALADIRPSPPESVITQLWAIVGSASSGSLEKLKGSEALIVADSWEGADIELWRRLLQETQDPYILKNYVLIGARAFPDSAADYLISLSKASCHSVVMDAIEYALGCQARCLALENEPDVLSQYYSREYPIVESDTKEIESPWG